MQFQLVSLLMEAMLRRVLSFLSGTLLIQLFLYHVAILLNKMIPNVAMTNMIAAPRCPRISKM